MSTDQQHFNQDFDAELTAAMMAKYRASKPHCHWCQKGQEDTTTAAAPTLFRSCSACRMAWYCNKECQKQAWKHGGHKVLCREFCNARDNLGLAAPVTMKYIGNITQDEYETLIWDRLGLFACELNRIATVRGAVVALHLQAAAILMMDGVYLAVASTIPGPAPGNPFRESVDVVNIPLLKIDEGQAAESQICQGSGRISKAAKKMVLKYLCQMLAIFKKQKVFPRSITYGRGLMFMTSDKAFTDKIQEAGNGYIMFMPSTDYIAASVMEAAMSGFYGEED